MSFDIAKYPTLALVDSTQELRLLPKESLPKLCDELRRYLLDSVSRSSGHFASGLGTVELTVALHYVYNTPFDQLIWDVGHQAYPHKILTGRRDKIGTIRRRMGIATRNRETGAGNTILLNLDITGFCYHAGSHFSLHRNVVFKSRLFQHPYQARRRD